jgi:hypothetical protein
MTIVIELRAHRDHQCAKISATDRATVVADLVTLSASIRDIVERTVELSSPSLLHLEQATQHLVHAHHQLEAAASSLTDDGEWTPF